MLDNVKIGGENSWGCQLDSSACLAAMLRWMPYYTITPPIMPLNWSSSKAPWSLSSFRGNQLSATVTCPESSIILSLIPPYGAFLNNHRSWITSSDQGADARWSDVLDRSNRWSDDDHPHHLDSRSYPSAQEAPWLSPGFSLSDAREPLLSPCNPATPPNPNPSTATVRKLFASERSPLTLFYTFEKIIFSTTRTGFGKFFPIQLLHDYWPWPWPLISLLLGSPRP